jgi:hypothetical protein
VTDANSTEGEIGVFEKVAEETLNKGIKPVEPAKKEIEDAARRKLMEIKEC